jgi:hypothetical protein
MGVSLRYDELNHRDANAVVFVILNTMNALCRP